MEAGVLDENVPNPELQDAIEVDVVRDMRPPSSERITDWKNNLKPLLLC